MTKKELKELMDLPLTDFGNAMRLQAIFGKRWVYLPRFKCWMYRDQYNWKGKRTRDICYVAHAESGVGTGRKNGYHFLADAFAAAYPCKKCGKNVPGYAVGGGSCEGRSAEGELGCVKYVLLVLIEYCLS